MKTLILVIFATFTASAYSDHHESAPMSTDGTFTTLQVAAPDIAKYRQTLIDNPSAFKATGTTAAGICVTNSGQDYVGQMMVWSAFQMLLRLWQRVQNMTLSKRLKVILALEK